MPFAFEEMSSELEHPVGVLVAEDEVLDDVLEVTVEEPEGRTEEPELSVGEPGLVEDEPGLSAAAAVAGVNFEE